MCPHVRSFISTRNLLLLADCAGNCVLPHVKCRGFSFAEMFDSFDTIVRLGG